MIHLGTKHHRFATPGSIHLLFILISTKNPEPLCRTEAAEVPDVPEKAGGFA